MRKYRYFLFVADYSYQFQTYFYTGCHDALTSVEVSSSYSISLYQTHISCKYKICMSNLGVLFINNLENLESLFLGIVLMHFQILNFFFQLSELFLVGSLISRALLDIFFVLGCFRYLQLFLKRTSCHQIRLSDVVLSPES